jgi:hypothetical protein
VAPANLLRDRRGTEGRVFFDGQHGQKRFLYDRFEEPPAAWTAAGVGHGF